MMMVARSRGQGWRIAGWSLGAGLLLLPAVAMRFTDGVMWKPRDFVVAAMLIGGVGFGLELALRQSRSRAYRAGAAVALLAAFGLIWVNGAVGIIGDEGAPANLLFGAVLAVALIAAAAARFRARGLASVMLIAAMIQAAIAAAAVLAGWGGDGPTWPWDVLGASALFTVLWLLSAALFRRAAIKSAA